MKWLNIIIGVIYIGGFIQLLINLVINNYIKSLSIKGLGIVQEELDDFLYNRERNND